MSRKGGVYDVAEMEALEHMIENVSYIHFLALLCTQVHVLRLRLNRNQQSLLLIALTRVCCSRLERALAESSTSWVRINFRYSPLECIAVSNTGIMIVNKIVDFTDDLSSRLFCGLISFVIIGIPHARGCKFRLGLPSMHTEKRASSLNH